MNTHRLMKCCRSFLTLAGCLAFSFSASAQQRGSPSPDDYHLRVDVNLTSVLATVTTPEGALVADLQQEDFQVLENGQTQTITAFGRESGQPLRLSLLFDSSVSVATEVRVEREAAVEFLRSILQPVDRVSIFQVSEDVDELVRGESRLDRIAAAIRSIKPRGGTSLYDAIYLAAETMSSGKARKVVLVVSDGTDTTSQTLLKDCLKMCQNAEVVIYALVVQPIKSEPGRNLGGEHAMIYLSDRTGGRFFKVISPESFRSGLAAISEELRTQYYLAWYSRNRSEEEEFRKIEIKVSRPDCRVRAREGYYTRK